MRVLSLKELRALNVDVSVFPDEHCAWMHVWLAVPWARSSEYRECSESGERLFQAAISPFHGQLMTYIPVEPTMYITPNEKIIKSRAFFREGSSEVLGVARIPTSALVLPDELEQRSITPRTGYLYLRADFVQLRERYGRYAEEVGNWQGWNYRRGSGHMTKRGATLSHLFFDTEIALNGRVRHNLNPLEHSYNAIDHSDSGVIFETPFEYPPGFIWETARALKRYFENDCPHLVEGFRQAVLAPVVNGDRARNTDAPPSRQASDDKSIPFPYEIRHPVLPKIDRTWRESSRANLVQTILLARLIGGRFWVQALASLEAMYGQEIDWSMLRA